MMRDKKISILLFVSFLLLLASFLILCSWVYNYYSDNRNIARSIPADPVRYEVTRDSLLKIYTHTIKELENKLGSTFTLSDSLESGLALKLDEYYRLKDELAVLLKSPSSNDDFKTAKIRIGQLQNNLNELSVVSNNVQKENARLHLLLAQVNKERIAVKNVQYVETPAPVNNPVSEEAEDKTETPFTAADMHLASVKTEQSDEDASNSNRKITATFTVSQSFNTDQGEIMVVIVQPDGKVLQKSAWESGGFTTTNGKKIYSARLRFPYTKGEAKKCTVTIETDKFQRGTYTMLIYSNGIVAGRITQVLT